MPRDFKVYLEDVLEAAGKIRGYTADLSYSDFEKDSKTVDAVIRNLEIIGEAVKHLPQELRSRHTDIEWRKVAGLRDVLSHAYFEVDLGIVWEVVSTKLPTLESRVAGILQEEEG